jgi:hypothetical protein
MLPRRALKLLLLLPATGHAQSRPPSEPPPPRAEEELPGRGAPAGRVGGATRGDGTLALDVLAPERGVGRAAIAAPVLHYRVTGRATQPLRVTLSAHMAPRPLLDLPLPGPARPGVHAVALPVGTRLPPGVLHVWSVAAVIDPRAPSRDVVASALLRHVPADAALSARIAAAPAGERARLWAEAGYFYDAVAAAVAAQGLDGGASLATLLRSVNL